MELRRFDPHQTVIFRPLLSAPDRYFTDDLNFNFGGVTVWLYVAIVCMTLPWFYLLFRNGFVVSVEVLVGDFKGDSVALDQVIEARPEILAHNMETVPRLYRPVRPGADFRHSIELLARAYGLLEERQ